MLRDLRRPLAAVAIALLFAPLTPAGAPAQNDRFADTADVFVVEIPVQVTKNGAPVRGLTAADFEVTEGRKRHEIVGFEAVDLTAAGEAAPGAPSPTVPAAARRHILFLFDLALSYPASILRAREAARQMVAGSLHPTDLAAVGVYTSTRGAQLVLGFTSDRRQIDAAIAALGAPQLLQTSPDPLGIVYADRAALRNTRETAPGLNPLVGVDAEAELTAYLESIETRTGRAVEKNKVLALASSLAALADMMAGIEGNKQVVFLSEGFDSSILFGRGVDSLADQQEIARANEAAASGQVWEVDSNARFGDTSSLNQIEQMTQLFVRAGCIIQSVDIGGLRADADQRPRRASDDGMYTLAEKTGGDYYRNFNDLSAAMDRMLERTSVTYLLAIQPDDLPSGQGEFRRLKVKVGGAGRGAEVSHRPGYYAPGPDDRVAGLVRRLETADLVLAGREGGAVDTSVLAAAFPGGSESAYVPVLIEISGPTLMAGNPGNVLPAEIYAYAIAADGSVEDYFTQSMGLDLDKVGGALQASGFKFWGDLELPPGRYQVRTVVRNSATGATGVRSTPLEVPRFAADEPALTPPLVPEPGGKWLLGREQGADSGAYDYPFLLDGEAFIPAARPSVAAGGALRMVFVGHNLGAGELALTGRLIDPRGTEVAGGRLVLETRSGGASSEQLTARFEPGDAPPGTYLLEVVAQASGGPRSTRTIALTVEG